MGIGGGQGAKVGAPRAEYSLVYDQLQIVVNHEFPLPGLIGKCYL